MDDIFRMDIESTATQIMSVFFDNTVSVTIDSIIELIPVIMDIAEKTYAKKSLRKRRKSIPAYLDEELMSLIHDGCFGKHKRDFVLAVIDKIALSTNTDIGHVRHHVPSIINAILTTSSNKLKVDKHQVSCGCY